MKTVTTINLNGRAYQVEEEAHKSLAAYLDKATSALAGNPDKDEILADFEQAIAEKCDRYLSTSKNVILHKEIETIIKEMGPVEGDSAAFEKETGGETKDANKPKRLYRDPDNRVIAGVASGIAQYFDIDVAIVRIVFAISVLLGGSGILVYIVLWLAVPEAESTAQKLEMRGSHVTLENMTDILKKKFEDVGGTDKKNLWEKIVSVPVTILRAIGQIIQKGILPILRAIIGAVFVFFGFIGAVGATIAIGAALFAAPAAVSDFAAITSMTGSILYVAMIAGYVAIMIPFIFIFWSGLGIIEKKNKVRGKIGLSFLALWFLAIIVAAVAGTRTGLEIQRSMATDASFQETSETRSLETFERLEAANGQNITFVEGDGYSVLLEGRKRDIEDIDATVAEGMLSIREKKGFDEGCFVFCLSGKDVRITVTAPKLSDITLKNGSSFEGDLSENTLVLRLKNASRADITIATATASFWLENGSYIETTGTTDVLEVDLANASRYEGSLLTAKNTSVTAQNGSHAEIGTSETLKVTAENGSRVEYAGTPTIEKDLRNGSSLEKIKNEE